MNEEDMDVQSDGILETADMQDASKMPKDFKMPTQEELLKLISGLDMSEEDKEDLKKNILTGQILNKMGLDPKSQQQHLDSSRILIFTACIAIMVLIFGELLKDVNSDVPDNMDPQAQEKLKQMINQILEEQIEAQAFKLTDLLFYLYVVFMVIFVFFGYKLYRSQTEKERKREEKKKQKQQKKKHK